MVLLWIAKFLLSLMPESLDDVAQTIELSILVLHDDVDGLIILGALACRLCFCLLFVFHCFCFVFFRDFIYLLYVSHKPKFMVHGWLMNRYAMCQNLSF